jgi:hypothetical protein
MDLRCPAHDIQSFAHGIDSGVCLECGRIYDYLTGKEAVLPDYDRPSYPPVVPAVAGETVLVASTPGEHPDATVGDGAPPQQGTSVPHGSSS